jgi:DNA modification methylase
MKTLHVGDSAEILKEYPDNHFDSIVTDPPYGISFLGKDWDKNTGAVEVWTECFRVLKPGGHLLAFSAARTYHHLATNVEGIGFEIRDQLMWLYSSGFPKAQDIGKAIQKRNGVKETKDYEHNAPVKGGRASSDDLGKGSFEHGNKDIVCTDEDAKQWEGWKTQLKPAHEPIVMARKPFKGPCIDNVQKHGTGALNIDASRLATDDQLIGAASVDISTAWAGVDHERVTDDLWKQHNGGRYPNNVMGEVEGHQKFFYNPPQDPTPAHEPIVMARKPFKGSCIDNVQKYGTGALNIEESRLPYENNADKLNQLNRPVDAGAGIQNTMGQLDGKSKTSYTQENTLSDQGRYPNNVMGDIEGYQKFFYCPKISRTERHVGFADDQAGNHHPTVKPVALMHYLVKLVTPPGGKVLDPFMGSGSTGMAVKEFGGEFVGIDLDAEHVDISTVRIDAWANPVNTYNDHFEETVCPKIIKKKTNIKSR